MDNSMIMYILSAAAGFFLVRLIYCCNEKRSSPPSAIEDSVRLAAMHKARVRDLWKSWGSAGKNGEPLKIALFGAGKFTAWLEKSVAGEPGPIVVAVIDDTPRKDFKFMGVPSVSPDGFNPKDSDMIVVCTDTYGPAMKARCAKLFDDIKICDPYAELPPGPYPKA